MSPAYYRRGSTLYDERLNTKDSAERVTFLLQSLLFYHSKKYGIPKQITPFNFLRPCQLCVVNVLLMQ